MTASEILEIKLTRLNSMVKERLVIDVDVNGYRLDKVVNEYGGHGCLTERMSRPNMIRVLEGMIEALKLKPVKE